MVPYQSNKSSSMNAAINSFYPEDLRSGLNPLVFVVSAINDTDDNDNGVKPLFDRFVDAISSSLMVSSDILSEVGTGIESDDNTANINTNSTHSVQPKQTTSRNVSLFRSDEDDDNDNSSDEEDELLLESFTHGHIRKKTGHSFGFGRRRDRKSVV